MDCEVNLYNAQSVTHFGCQNWEALCKMYGFYEGMIVTMDLVILTSSKTIWTFGSLLIRFRLYRYVSFSNIVINESILFTSK